MEIWGVVGRYAGIWGDTDMGRYGETQTCGDMGRDDREEVPIQIKLVVN